VNRIIIFLLSLVLAMSFFIACGDDDDDDNNDDNDNDDDDIGDDDDDNDDNDTGDDDDDTGDDDNDTGDDDTVAPLCAEPLALAYACGLSVNGGDALFSEEEAVADCENPTIHNAEAWDCILDCADQLEDDCTNTIDLLACIPLCVYHQGPVPDECVPAYPNFPVCAHRGATLYAPENTVPAWEAAIAQGAAYIEVDVRETSDDVLVCMHDSDVSRTTDGEGEVNEMTLAEIQALTVDDSGYDDAYPDLRVPTFAEALATMKDHAMIDIDCKTSRVDLVVAEVAAANMEDQVMVYCSNLGKVDAFLAIDPDFPVMPKAESPEDVLTIVTNYDPPYVEIDENCDDAASIALIHGDGALVFQDALGMADLIFLSLGLFDGWLEMMESGVDVIQSDLSHVLIAFTEAVCQ